MTCYFIYGCKIKRHLRNITVLFGIIFALSSNALTQLEDSVVLNAKVNKTRLPLDEELKFNATLTWNKDIFDLSFDMIEPPNCENLYITGNFFASDSKSTPNGQVVSNHYGFLIKPVNVGSATIGPVSLTYTDNISGEEKTLTTSPITITVTKPLSDRLYPFKIAAKYLVMSIVIFIIFWTIIHIIRKKRENKKALMELKSRPTLETIYTDELKSIYLIRQTIGNKEFSSKISLTLKKYLEEKFELKLLGATTDRIITTLSTIDLLNQEIVDLLMSIFDFCDKVKFAGKELNQDNVDNLQFKAETFISNMKNIVNSDDRGVKDEPGYKSNKRKS